MSVVWVSVLAGLVVLLSTNAYWWNRLRAVERGQQTSEEWDEAIDGERYTTGTVDTEQEALLNRTAAKADVPPEELPERVDELDDKIRDLQSRIEKMRSGWVSTYWQALDDGSIDLTNPHTVVVDLESGVHDDARAFGIHAMEQEQEVVIALAHADETFAVGVSEPLTDQFGVTADGIATELTEGIAGGAGGMESLATGGVEDVNALSDAIAEYRPNLETALGGQTGSSESVEHHSTTLDAENGG